MSLVTIALTLLVVGLCFTAMAVGVLLGRKPIQGSCGGLGAVGVEGDCGACSKPADQCPRKQAAREAEGSAAS
ncbi:MAG: (Na+)-NQR maturation NqrM [Aquimonas sp.]|nr:(Na+)-NQR maturation NqrM [Aquimonas sp.]